MHGTAAAGDTVGERRSEREHEPGDLRGERQARGAPLERRAHERDDRDGDHDGDPSAYEPPDLGGHRRAAPGAAVEASEASEAASSTSSATASTGRPGEEEVERG